MGAYLNGEPLLYPHLGDALRRFSHCVRCLNTNTKLLCEKAGEITGNLETLTISVIEGADEQYEIVKKYSTVRKALLGIAFSR